jgi:hypothetical protein
MKKELGKPNYQRFHDGCKARAHDLVNLRERMSRLTDIEDLLYVPRGYTEALDIRNTNYFGKGGNFYAVLEDDIEIVGTISVQPYWYSSLYKAMYSCMRLYSELVQTEDRAGARSVMQVALQVQTWGNIYDELRSNKPMTIEQEEKMFQTLSETESNPLSEDPELLDLFDQVVKDIKEGTLPYVMDFHESLEDHEDRMRSTKFSFRHYYVSGKTSSYRHKDGELRKSILSSAYETDPVKDRRIDDLIGYESNYNTEFKGAGKPHPMITLSIPQSKMKRRIIHIGSNAIQDRGKYLHDILQSFLATLGCDCTKDQRAGIAFAERVSNPGFRSSAGYPSIMCMDFSNATDLLSQEFQNKCLGILFPDEVVSFWNELSQMEKVFIFSNGKEKKYNQRRGQPQGLLGSFDCFALAHHVIMLMTMKLTGREGYRANQFYRILGDDSIVSSIKKDPDHEVLSAYRRISRWAGLEENETKLHYAGFDQKTSVLCEFAKVTVLNGVMSTPVPIRLLSRNGREGTNYHRMSSAMWMAINGYDQLRTEIFRLLPSMFSEEAVLLASDIISSGIIPAFHMFADRSRIVDMESVDQCIFCYIVQKLRGSFLSALLTDEESERFFDSCEFDMETISPFLIKGPKINDILDVVENDNHKIMRVIGRNLELEDAIKSILGLNNQEKLVVGAVDLTAQEMRLYLWISEVLDNLKLGIPLPSMTRIDWIDRLEATSSLERFMPRAFHKKILREIVFLDKAIEQTKIWFPSHGTGESDGMIDDHPLIG